MTTALGLVQAACYSGNLPAPAALVGGTDATVLQYLNLFYDTGRELRQKRWWPQLKKKFTITLVTGQQQYQLPQDFYASLPQTQWDQANRWELLGPTTDREWQYRTYGYVTIENRKAYKVWGTDINPSSLSFGQFFIDPPPTTANAGTTLTLEYISKSWLCPPSWVAGTTYSAVTPNWVNVNGNIYKCTTGGTASSTHAPNMAYGIGRDGGVQWSFITKTAWAGTTVYSVGDYVTNGGNLYLCSVGGTSGGGGGPTGMTAMQTEGTVTWTYTAAPAWAAETAYLAGAVVSKGGNYYLNTTPNAANATSQISGKFGPDWTATTVPDNAATWTFQPQAYEGLVTDSDLCLFDEDIMIEGLKWRFLRARGLEFQSIRDDYDNMVDTAVNRWVSGRKISLANEGFILAGLNPRISEGNFG